MINKFIEGSKIFFSCVGLILFSIVICTFTHLSPNAVEATPFYINDDIYSSSWNGIVNKAATKNAIYDYLHQIDPDNGGTVDLDEVGNPGASKTFTQAGYTLTFGSVTDQWGGVTISNSNAAVTGETKLLTLSFDNDDTTDVNLTFLEIISDASDDGDGQETVLKLAGGTTRSQLTGNFDLVISALDMGDNNITNVGDIALDSLSADGTDISIVASSGTVTVESVVFTTGALTGVTSLTSTGAIIGELSEIDDGDVASDDLTAAQCRGTLITNEGAGGAVEYDLPTAEQGLHFKAICASTAGDMDFEAKDTDKIYISDDDALAVTSDGDTVAMDCANVGESMTCVAFTTDDSAWDWLCECGAGTCEDGGAGGGN